MKDLGVTPLAVNILMPTPVIAAKNKKFNKRRRFFVRFFSPSKSLLMFNKNKRKNPTKAI